MGIKSALGWLALLLFTTTAQAEGTRELLKVAPKSKAPLIASVTPKTKAPGPLIGTQNEGTPQMTTAQSARICP